MRTPRLAALATLAVVAACGSPGAMGTTAEPEPERPACVGNGYTVRYPPGWFVLPGNDALDIGPCELFAREPFAVVLEDEGGWSEDAVRVRLKRVDGCVGFTERVASREDVEVDGFAAFRDMLESGGEPPAHRAYGYIVPLVQAVDCSDASWFLARTESSNPGSFEQNGAVLDEMMSTIDIEAP
jgi:hypothetical protein